MAYTNKDFLGKGWSFPPTFDDTPGRGVDMVSNEVDIRESLEILLNTNLGERVMLPEYGSNVRSHLFEAISNSKNHFLKESIRVAILRYEPRIILNEIYIDHTDYLDGIVKVQIDYTVESTNTRFNLVYPYYREEGTDIPKLFREQIQQTSIDL